MELGGSEQVLLRYSFAVIQVFIVTILVILDDILFLNDHWFGDASSDPVKYRPPGRFYCRRFQQTAMQIFVHMTSATFSPPPYAIFGGKLMDDGILVVF